MPNTTVVDCTGLTCPQPLMKLKKAMGSVAVGDIIELLATDPGAVGDVSVFCRKTGQELVELIRQGEVDKFVIKRLT